MNNTNYILGWRICTLCIKHVYWRLVNLVDLDLTGYVRYRSKLVVRKLKQTFLSIIDKHVIRETWTLLFDTCTDTFETKLNIVPINVFTETDVMSVTNRAE